MPMLRASASIRRTRRRFAARSDGQSGAGAVEFALIIPFLLLLIIGIVEMSNIYFIRNQMNEIVRDATRRLAIGALTKSTAETFVLQRLAETSNLDGEVEVSEEEVDEIVDVTLSLRVPFADILLFDHVIDTLWAEAPTHLTIDATMMKH